MIDHSLLDIRAVAEESVHTKWLAPIATHLKVFVIQLEGLQTQHKNYECIEAVSFREG